MKTKHGFSKHLLYSVWKQMKYRCINPNNKEYKRYGARGISVYNDWLKDPGSFINYCLNLEKDPWKVGLEIDRINNNGNYEPGNIRFVNRRTNAGNTRKQENRNLPVGIIKIKNTYYVSIFIKCKTISLGNFKNINDASKAYQDKLKEISK